MPDEESNPPPYDDEPEEDLPQRAMAGRVGIVGHDYAASSRSSCLLCLEQGLSAVAKIPKGAGRFFWRGRANKPDRSLHEACVVSGGVLSLNGRREAHCRDSVTFLSHLAGRLQGTDLGVTLQTACDVFRAHLSGPSSSSGSGSAAA